MKLKKVLSFVVLTALCLLTFAGCGDNGKEKISSMMSEVTGIKYKDGEYTATANDYDDQGYKATVTVLVRDGEVRSVDCNAVNKDGQKKKQLSEEGKYSMKAGGAKYEWHEQIARFEEYVVAHGTDSVSIKSDQKTDVITGCTIKVKEYVDLVNKALSKARM